MLKKSFSKLLQYFRTPLRLAYYLVFLAALVTPFVVCSFGSDAQYEYASTLVTTIAKKSITGSANFNAVVNDESSIEELVEYSDMCAKANYQRNAGSYYNFRTVFDANENTYLTLDDCDDMSVTILPHSSSGSPHKNAKDENVHSSFEIKLMFDASKTNRSNPNNTSYVYIRKELATKIMKTTGNYSINAETDDFGEEEYEKFKNEYNLPVTYRYAGSNISYKLSIANIILPNEGYDSFFINTFGEYFTICANSYLKNAMPSYDGFSVNFDFGSSYYETSRYFGIINEMCDKNKFQYHFNLRNQVESSNSSIQTANDVCQIIGANNHSLSKVLVTCISIGAFIIFGIIFTILFALKRIGVNAIVDSAVFCIEFFIVYSIFFLLSHALEKMIVYFSSNAIMISLLAVAIIIALLFLFNSLTNKRKISAKDKIGVHIVNI